MKTCNLCKVEKPFSEFYKEKRNTISGLRGDCKECCRKRSLEKYIPVPQETKRTHKGYTDEQKKLAHNESSKAYYFRNKDKTRIRRASWKKEKRLSDPIFRLKEAISANINFNIKKYLNQSKSYRTPEYLGCSFEQLFVHLSSQFVDGMNWGNYGLGKEKWNIDHALPVSMAMTEDDLLILNHYTNLRPMWHDDNVKKSNKILL
jgi:hypothetical protein